jgi:integrase
MQTGAYSATQTVEQRPSPTLQRTSTPGIYKRGRRYYVVYRDPAGRQRKKSQATLADARAFKAAVASAISRGDYLPNPKLSFDDYARQWITGYGGRTARGLRPRTRRSYLLALGLDRDGNPTGAGAVAYFGRRQLVSIRPPDIREYGEWLADQGLARNTIRVTLAPIKAMFACAYEDGLLRDNPAARLRMGPKALTAPLKDTHALTEAELRRVLDEIPPAYQLAIDMLADTGLRIGELLALRKRDIDVEQRLVDVTQSIVDGDRGVPKTTSSARFVAFSPELAARLSARLTVLDNDERVFVRSNGRPFDRSRLYHVVREAGERAGIEWAVGLHTLRHTFATLLFRHGVPKEQIRTALGHRSWEFTARVYLHDNTIPSVGALGFVSS